MKRILFFIGSAVFALGAVVMAQQRAAQLPEPQAPHPNPSRVVSRPEGAMPKVPAGFTVDIYADNIQGPRMMEWFGMASPRPTYGRLAIIHCNREPAVELLEIVASE